MAHLNSKLNENHWTYSLAEITIGKLLARGSQKWSCLGVTVKSDLFKTALLKCRPDANLPKQDHFGNLLARSYPMVILAKLYVQWFLFNFN